jgi:hypothetical protein
MGLLDKLLNPNAVGGTSLTAYHGTTPSVNPLATKSSKLHADGGAPGYSLNGSNKNQVTADYTEYNDGYNNALPQPSQLDLNGKSPSKYLDNPPR